MKMRTIVSSFPLIVVVWACPAAAMPIAPPPVLVDFADCDRLGRVPNHELGETAAFDESQPRKELISGEAKRIVNANVTSCFAAGSDNNLMNDWRVSITNTSGLTWTELYFVVDEPFTIANFDGTINDEEAIYLNDFGGQNVIRGDRRRDGLFSPGEVWRFTVINFVTVAPQPGAPNSDPSIFESVGFAGGSVGGGSTASILARCVGPVPPGVTIEQEECASCPPEGCPVPEPAMMLLTAAGIACALRWRPRARPQP